jgi:hypothetical protein
MQVSVEVGGVDDWVLGAVRSGWESSQLSKDKCE